MNRAEIGRLIINSHTLLTHHLAQLGIDILPFTNAQVIEKIALTLTTEGITREFFLLLAQIIPQIHESHEIGIFILEATVFLIGGLLFLQWTLTRILNRQRGGDDHDFTHTTVFRRFQYHPSQTWVDRQLGQFTSHRGQTFFRIILFRIERAKLFQQTHAVLDIALIWRFDKRECRDIAQTQRCHLQNNRG